MAVIYYRHGDGSVSSAEVIGPGEIVPADAAEITVKEYASAVVELTAHRDAHRAELLADDEARTRGDFEALIAVGIAEGTARRLSGWEG